MYLHLLRPQPPERRPIEHWAGLRVAEMNSPAYKESSELILEARLEVVTAEMAAEHYPSEVTLDQLRKCRRELCWAYDLQRQVRADLLDDLLDS